MNGSLLYTLSLAGLLKSGQAMGGGDLTQATNILANQDPAALVTYQGGPDHQVYPEHLGANMPASVQSEIERKSVWPIKS